MHPAMACAEKPVPYLQGNCLVLAFMVRGLSLFHHFSLLTHCGGGLLFFDRGCAPALFVPACVQAGCYLWFQDTSWMSSVQLCILFVVPSSIVLVSIVPPSGKSRDIDVLIELEGVERLECGLCLLAILKKDWQGKMFVLHSCLGRKKQRQVFC
ncbi:hypothetical protein CY35_02G066200 [Sphagnum magellanicum]|jgi:hypothetical protein|nr:hypothetical protein CY35_02G066200 [Sphagnum magellanicum]